MVSHEIITLQVGNYSNFVGAHWYNIQQNYLGPDSEFDPIVTWRQSLSTSAGVRTTSWTPRVLIFDLKQNWSSKSLTTQSSSRSTHSSSDSKIEREKFLQEVERNVLWHGAVQRVGELEEISSSQEIPEKRIKENNTGLVKTEASANISRGLQKVEIDNSSITKEIKSWSDYVQWKLPSSERVTFTLPNFSHNSSDGILSNFGQGVDICSKLQDDIGDGIRFYAEDCDYLQGFQLLADQHDGYGGLAKGILQEISDDYEKKCSFVFGMSPADSEIYKKEKSREFRHRLSNIALCWNSFNHHSSVFTSLGLSDDLCKPNPISKSLSWVNYEGDSSYESSAIIAAALDTLTAGYRIKSSNFGFSEMIGLLNGYSRKMTSVGSAFPLSLVTQTLNTGLTERTLFEALSETGLDGLLTSLTPGVLLSSAIDSKNSIGNYMNIRGVTNDKVISEKESLSLQQQRHDASSSKITTSQSCLELYSQEICPKSVNVVRSVATPFKLSHPFPTHLVDQTFLQTQPKFRYQTQDYWNLPAMASAHNTSETGALLGKLIEEISPEKMRKSNFSLEESNIELDDYSECINDLRVLRDSYNNN